MRRMVTKLGLLILLVLLPWETRAQPVSISPWTVTDSTLVTLPHSDLAQALQWIPALRILTAGGHGQPGFLSAGFGNIFGPEISFNQLEQDSYLLPFFDPLLWSPAFLGKARFAFFSGKNGLNFATAPDALLLQSFWKQTRRPFVRVHYLTHDFGREEMFALFQKQVNPTLRIQPFGAIGNYSGWRSNSALHFQQTGAQVEKRLTTGKILHLFALSNEFEAGFPGLLSPSWSPAFPKLKRKVREQRFQGRLDAGSDSTGTEQSWNWEVRRLREEWTRRGPFFHRTDEEVSGTFFWKASGKWRGQNWQLAPGGRVSRIRYRSEVQSVWQARVRWADFFRISPNWAGKTEGAVSLGNWGTRSLSLATGVQGQKWGKPAATLHFEEHHGGFLPPVLRDSTSFHWSWLRATPPFQAAQLEPRKQSFRVVREELVWPLAGRKIWLLLRGVHWLKLPGDTSSGSFHAVNASLWGRWEDAIGLSAEGMANFRVVSAAPRLLTSALPAVDAVGAIGFRHVFFQGDLHAAVKLIGRFEGTRQANKSSQIGAPLFVTLPAAGFLDFYAHFRVADLRFFVSLENILNNASETLPGYPVPGRHFRFGLVWDFWN